MDMRIFAFLLFTSIPLIAQGLAGNGISPRSAALGGAFQEGDLTAAMAINPAVLALVGVPSADLMLTAVFGSGQFQNRVDRNGQLQSNLGFMPYGAIAIPVIRNRFTAAAALLPETALSAKWRYIDPVGAAGASWGDYRHRSSILAVRTAFGFGWYLNKYISVGGTAGIVYNENTLQTPYIFQRHPVLTGLKTALDLKTTGTGWNGTIGVLARPNSRLQFGAAYKTRTWIESHGVAQGTLDRQLAAIGLAAKPDYRYDAQVNNTLPQSMTVNLDFQAMKRLRLLGQLDWINWSRAFRELPVYLTKGNNADVNSLLGSNAIRDGVPLNWRDQYVWRVGAEVLTADNVWVRAGAFFTQSPVPNSTLTPLTATIMKNALTTGAGWRRGRWRFDAAYAVNLPASQSVGTSGLAGGEYSQSKVRIWIQTVSASASVRF